MKTIKLNGVEVTEEEIRRAYADLEIRRAYDELQKKEDWPKEGEEFFFVTSSNQQGYDKFTRAFYRNYEKMKEVGNCFRTKEEAEKEILRRECAKRKWDFVPKMGDKYICMNNDEVIYTYNWGRFPCEIIGFHAGFIFPNTDQGKKDCLSHWEKYKSAFELPS